ncbi:MAG: SCO family protein [Stellaceae bacterium]
MTRLALVLLAMLLATPARAAPSGIPAADFASFAFDQHPGAQLPLNVTLRSGGGKPVKLGSLFDGKPVLLDFEYDRCTTLCGVMLDQITTALRSLPLKAGGDYHLIAVDIDPDTTPQQAADFAKAHGAAGAGMTVLTGDEAAIRRLAEAAGFPYRRDPATGQYAHPAGLLVATPSGAVSRYLLGFDWRPFDLRLALTEAGKATIAAPAQAVLLFCYCYDPQTGRYDLAIGRLLDIVGAATLLAIAGLVWAAARRRPNGNAAT